MTTLTEALWEAFSSPLRPDAVVKHEGGPGHVQSSHGNWARGARDTSPVPSTSRLRRLSEDEMRRHYRERGIKDMEVWSDTERNMRLVIITGGDGLVGEGLAVPREHADRVIAIVDRLQANAPLSNAEVTIVYSVEEAVASVPGLAPSAFPWMSRGLMGLTKAGRSDFSPAKDDSADIHIEVSVERALRKGVNFPHEYQTSDPLATVLAHEWAHGIARSKGWTAWGTGQPKKIESWNEWVDARNRATGKKFSEEAMSGEPVTNPREFEARDRGWTAYGLSNWDEGLAEAFTAWALGGREVVPDMVAWGEKHFKWSEFITLPDGRIIPMEKAAGDIIGIGCTFDPAVGPVWLHAEDVAKHQGGEGHEQLSHGNWARGRQAKLVAGSSVWGTDNLDSSGPMANKHRVASAVSKRIVERGLSNEEIAAALYGVMFEGTTAEVFGAGGQMVMYRNKYGETARLPGRWNVTWSEAGQEPLAWLLSRMSERHHDMDSAFVVGSDMTDLQRENAAYALVDEVVDRWSHSSNWDYVSMAAQIVAQDEFGLKDAVDPTANAPKTERAEQYARKHGKVLRAVLRGMYDETQYQLKKAFPGKDSMLVFRGGDSDNRFGDGQPVGDSPVGATLYGRPLQSFSTSAITAANFAAGKESFFASVVPFSRLIALHTSGYGSTVEREVVVLGGKVSGTRYPLGGGYIDEREVFASLTGRPSTASGEFITIDGQPVPVFKHEGGGHEQSSHGNWARGKTAAKNTLRRDAANDGLGASAIGSDNKAEVEKRIGKRLAESSVTNLQMAEYLNDVDYNPWDNRTRSMVVFNERRERWTVEMGATPSSLYQHDARIRSLMEMGLAFFADEAETPEQRMALARVTVDSIIDEWSASSNKTPGAAAAQMAARDEFGMEAAAGLSDPDGAADWYRKHGGLFRTVLRAQYEETQEFLRDRFPEHDSVVLFRGGDSPRRYGQEGWTVRDTVRAGWDYLMEATRPTVARARHIAEAFNYGGDMERAAKTITRNEVARYLDAADVSQEGWSDKEWEMATYVVAAATDEPQMDPSRIQPDAQVPPKGVIRSTLTGRPMMSFSTSPVVATGLFGGSGPRTGNQGIMAVVPFERILSTVRTGYGSTVEEEWVVLGGPIHGLQFADMAFDEVQLAIDREERRGLIGSDVVEFITIDGQPVPVFKHEGGEGHEQLSHGNWARGRERANGATRPRKVRRFDGGEMAELARKLGVSAQTVDFPIEDLPDVVRGFNPDIFADAHDVAYEDVGRRLQSGDEFARMNGRLNAVVLDTNSGQVVHAWGATRELKEGVRVIDEEVWNTLPVEQRNRAIDLLRRAYMGGKDFYAEVGLALQEIMSPSDWSRIGGRSVDRIEAKEMSQQNVIAGMRSLPLETLNRAHLYLSQHLVEHDRERSGNRTELNQLAYALISNEDPVIAIQMKFSPDHPKADTPDNVPIRIKVDRTGQPPPSRSSEWKVGTLDDPEIEDAAKSLLLTRFSYGLIKAWSETSNRSSVANLVQNAAAEEFGIGAAAAPAGASDLHGAGSPTTRVARAFVRAQYEATQKMLAEQYPDTTHFVLFRGGDSEQRYSDTDNTGETWRQATLRTRPLASFSTSMGEAEEFLSEAESRLFAAAVPRERILSTPFTGNGAVIESEFVVLGGPIRGRYTGDRSSDVDFDFNVDDLPMGETEFIMIDGQPVPIGKAAYAAASQEVPNG